MNPPLIRGAPVVQQNDFPRQPPALLVQLQSQQIQDFLFVLRRPRLQNLVMRQLWPEVVAAHELPRIPDATLLEQRMWRRLVVLRRLIVLRKRLSHCLQRCTCIRWFLLVIHIVRKFKFHRENISNLNKYPGIRDNISPHQSMRTGLEICGKRRVNRLRGRGGTRK